MANDDSKKLKLDMATGPDRTVLMVVDVRRDGRMAEMRAQVLKAAAAGRTVRVLTAETLPDGLRVPVVHELPAIGMPSSAAPSTPYPGLNSLAIPPDVMGSQLPAGLGADVLADLRRIAKILGPTPIKSNIFDSGLAGLVEPTPSDEWRTSKAVQYMSAPPSVQRSTFLNSAWWMDDSPGPSKKVQTINWHDKPSVGPEATRLSWRLSWRDDHTVNVYFTRHRLGWRVLIISEQPGEKRRRQRINPVGNLVSDREVEHIFDTLNGAKRTTADLMPWLSADDRDELLS